MKIAVVGCSHGELEKMYYRAQELEHENNMKIDLLICCGDFQATRNEADLRCMAVPPKYADMKTFYKYYSGEKTAPILTLFIGGNHEASNYLQELPYGGWIAPNIYYLGYAGVVNYGGLRIGGLSGIYKAQDYMKGHFEKVPYNRETLRSVYHVRNLEVFRLKQISNTLDIMLSHDWPREVYTYGDVDELLRNKPFFEQDVNENKLGSAPAKELLAHLKPKNWFAAHLHTKFCVEVPHFDKDGSHTSDTHFMALDKCLPRRKWIEVVDIPATDDSRILTYDLEWITILYLTDHLVSSKRCTQFMPGPSSDERWNFTPTDDEKAFVKQRMNDNLQIPDNFVRTAPYYDGYNRNRRYSGVHPQAVINPQTVTLCERLGIRDPIAGVEDLDRSSHRLSSPAGYSTPDKFSRLNDTTYMSFNSSCTSDRNESFSSRSSMCSNISVFESTPDQSSKKVKLSLPPIAHSSIDITDDQSDFSSVRQSDESADVADESSDIGTLSFTIDRDGSLPKTPCASDSDYLSFTTDGNDSIPATPVRSFKRRNADLYRD